MKRKPINIMLKLLVLIKPLIPMMIFAVIAGTLGFISAILIPSFASSKITDFILKESVVNQSNIKSILLYLISFAFLRGCLRYIEQYSNHNLAFKILARIRHIVFKKLRGLSPAKLDRKDKGNLITIITQDIELLEVFYAHTISPILIAILISITMTLFYLKMSFIAALVSMCAYVTIGYFIPIYYGRINEKNGHEYRNGVGEFNSHYLENLYGINDIVQYSAFDVRFKESERITDEMTKIYRKLRFSEGKQNSTTSFCIMLFSLLMVITTLLQVKENQISFNQMVIICVSFMSSFGAVVAISNLSSSLHQTLSAADRILDILEEKPQLEDVISNINADFDEINLFDVTFKYPNTNKTILNNLDINIRKNEIVGLKGKSGCGKTTMLKLLMRFYEVCKGEIKFSNKNINEIDTSSLRNIESYFSQSTVIFNDSVLENIRMFNDKITREEVVQAAKDASLNDFILTLENGYDTILSPQDRLLSDGEKQRLGLARSLVRKSELIILDEPTANLDALNEGTILKALNRLKNKKTLIISSHKDKTLSIADKIYKF